MGSFNKFPADFPEATAEEKRVVDGGPGKGARMLQASAEQRLWGEGKE